MKVKSWGEDREIYKCRRGKLIEKREKVMFGGIPRRLKDGRKRKGIKK